MTGVNPGPQIRVVLPPVLRSGTAIPQGVQLTTDHPDLGVTAGVITSHAPAAVAARITVWPALGVTDTFDVTVLPATAPVLLAGVRLPDADPAVYAPRIAYSLHLALATPDGTVTRLNDDRGILFPRAVPTEHADIHRVRTLTDPWVFAVPGGYAVVASPALPDGSPEPAADAAVLLFQSPDLVTYEEIGLVTVTSGGGLRHPRAAYDQARAEVVLWWTDDAGQAWSSHAAELRGPWAPPVASAPVVPVGRRPGLSSRRTAHLCSATRRTRASAST